MHADFATLTTKARNTQSHPLAGSIDEEETAEIAKSAEIHNHV